MLQIATAFLLQSATRFISNCDWYYKVRWIYYKLRQVLQSAMIITTIIITRRAPCKVEKLTKKANLTEMENLAKIANLTKIRHGFGKYSNWIVANMTKIGKSASNGKNVESG